MKRYSIIYLAAVTITVLSSFQVNAQNETIDVLIEDIDEIMHTPMVLESISSESIGVSQSGIQQKTKRWRFRLGPVGSGTFALMHVNIEVTYTIQNKKFTGVVGHNTILTGGLFGIYFQAGSFSSNISNEGKDLSWDMSGVLGFTINTGFGPVGWSRMENFGGEVYLDDFGDFDGDGGDVELINVNRY